MTAHVPAGEEVLVALRRPDLARPSSDPALPSEIRRYLESAVADQLPLPAPLRVTKDTVRRALRCEAHVLAHLAEDSGAPNPAMIAGSMADRLFSQAVVGFAFGDDPVEDALASANASGDRALHANWDGLDTVDQQQIRAALTSIVGGLAERWPRLPSNAFPRLQNSMRIELCGGQVILAGRVDLAIGEPRDGVSGTVLIDAKSGKARNDDREDASWYGLLETLRSGVPPFQSGNYYLATGVLDLNPITIDDLHRAKARAAEAINRLSRLAAGAAPTRSPGPLCPWCPAYSRCDEGKRHVGGSQDSTDLWLDDFEDDRNEDGIVDV